MKKNISVKQEPSKILLKYSTAYNFYYVVER